MLANQSLLLDLYELTMAQCYFFYKRESYATFDLFVRDFPARRSYLVAAGLGDILDFVTNLRFGSEDIRFLEGLHKFKPEFLDWLRNFKFSGDIWAMPEGTVFFPNEPIIRVTAPLIEAQLLESFFLNTINLQTMIASKAARIVSAAQGRQVFDFSFRRTHGPEAGLKVARACYIAGCAATSNVLASKLYGIPAVGTMAHSFVMSFSKELASFDAYANNFPDQTILLVDTYDTYKGIFNAIKVGLSLQKKGFQLKGIRLDSGDIVRLSKFARKKLDAAGLRYVKIVASGNLDEFKIAELINRKAQVDSFGVGTNMGTSSDAPCLDVIYKLCEVSDANKNFLPTMKLSKGKVTFPGRKQVYRFRDKQGRFIKDILVLEREQLKGEPLLIKVVEKGRLIYSPLSLADIRQKLNASLANFPKELFSLSARYNYPVLISSRLKGLMQNLIGQLAKRQ